MNQRERKRLDEELSTLLEVVDAALQKLTRPQEYEPGPQRDLIEELLAMAPHGLSTRQQAQLDARRRRYEELKKS